MPRSLPGSKSLAIGHVGADAGSSRARRRRPRSRRGTSNSVNSGRRREEAKAARSSAAGCAANADSRAAQSMMSGGGASHRCRTGTRAGYDRRGARPQAPGLPRCRDDCASNRVSRFVRCVLRARSAISSATSPRFRRQFRREGLSAGARGTSTAYAGAAPRKTGRAARRHPAPRRRRRQTRSIRRHRVRRDKALRREVAGLGECPPPQSRAISSSVTRARSPAAHRGSHCRRPIASIAAAFALEGFQKAMPGGNGGNRRGGNAEMASRSAESAQQRIKKSPCAGPSARGLDRPGTAA